MRRIGSLVVNPGGPGVSGEVRARFDVVGFDPRGVGDSRITCDGGSMNLLSQDLSPDDATQAGAVLDAAQDFAASCWDTSGDLLPHVGTREGDRHTAFGGENVCTDRAVVRYLVDLIPPDPTRTCG